MEPTLAADLEVVIEHARVRAARSGELRPVVTGSFAAAVSDEVADFVQQILTDGTYARAVKLIGEQDPDLANI